LEQLVTNEEQRNLDYLSDNHPVKKVLEKLELLEKEFNNNVDTQKKQTDRRP